MRPYKEGATRVFMQTHGFSINLFEGKWDKPNDYLKYGDKAKEQVDNGGYLTTLNDNSEWEIPRNIVDELFNYANQKYTYSAKFIFEGVSVVGGVDCEEELKKDEEDIKTCYLEMRFEQQNDEGEWEDVGKTKKLYIIFREISDLYDHYTVDGKWNDNSGSYQEGVLLANAIPAAKPSNKYEIGLWDDEHKDQYILFVHGWRMQPPERMFFAETALKRLYWQGYKGKYGFFSWPTKWFDKPAWVGPVDEAIRAAGHPYNYDTSEAIARRSGTRLATLLQYLKSENKNPVNIFAHSMGNIVVSEALLSSTGIVVNNYVALQSAATADAYTSDAPRRTEENSRFPYDHWVGRWQNVFCCHTAFYELKPDGTRSMYVPPLPGEDNTDPNPITNLENNGYRNNEVSDMYSFVTPGRHALAPDKEEGADYRSYYSGIRTSIQSGGIWNFYNRYDYALEGWQFNQILKPDIGTGYTREIEYTNPEASKDEIEKEWIVIDHWEVNGIDIEWQGGRMQNPGHPEIMAFTVPARSFALGADPGLAGLGEIGGSINLSQLGVTGQSYDHSAEFLSNIIKRGPIWQNLLGAFGLRGER